MAYVSTWSSHPHTIKTWKAAPGVELSPQDYAYLINCGTSIKTEVRLNQYGTSRTTLSEVRTYNPDQESKMLLLLAGQVDLFSLQHPSPVSVYGIEFN